MIASVHLPRAPEQLLAELTAAAYEVALRHGIGGSFLDLELELWDELRAVLAKRLPRAPAERRRPAAGPRAFRGEQHDAFSRAQQRSQSY
jgi:hypothetical protein